MSTGHAPIVYGYIRTSTGSPDPALQHEMLTRLGVELIYADHAWQARDPRPQFATLMQEATAKDTVIVWRLDRIALTLTQLIATVDNFIQRDIGFRSISEGIDTTDPKHGELQRRLFTALKADIRSRRRENAITGLHAARAMGRNGGRPKALSSEQIAHLKTLRAQGATASDLAASFNISRSTVHRYLSGSI